MTQPPRQFQPDAAGLGGHRNLGIVPALLAHETPGAARLLVGDAAAFQDDNGGSSLREVIGGCAADDAAPNYDDIGRGGYLGFIRHDKLAFSRSQPFK